MSKYEVDIDLANAAKKNMAKIMDLKNPRVLNKVGAFSSLYDITFPEYKEPVMVLKTEEPGSKQLLAAEYDKIENIAYDMINHLINDCIVMGAKPLTVQDAIICGKLDKGVVERIVKAVADACSNQDCVLTGGETSEQPGVLEKGVFILTSSIVGIVEKSEVIDGGAIEEGDAVLALASSGIHTNGYTLVRKIMRDTPAIENEVIDGKSFIDTILTPHRCYYTAVKDLFKTHEISGMAHITGGGIKENLNRILPQNLDAEIDLSKYKVLPIFKLLKKYGGVSDEEMIRTFNLGVGLTMVVKSRAVSRIIEHIKNFGIDCYEIGAIRNGMASVILKNSLNWN